MLVLLGSLVHLDTLISRERRHTCGLAGAAAQRVVRRRGAGSLAAQNLRVRRGQRSHGLSGILSRAVRVGRLYVGGTTVNVVLLGHDLDLVVGQLGQLGSDECRATLAQVSVGEQHIELFETAAGGFGVEDVDERQEHDVGKGEEEEGVGADGGGHGGQHLDDQEVGDPVGHCGNGVGLGSYGHRVELGGVEPREGKPCGTEERDEQVQSERGALGSLGAACLETPECDEHGETLADCTDQEELATTHTLHEEERGQGEGGVDDREDSAEDERQTGLETDLVFEKDRAVIDHGVTTSNLLEELCRGADEGTTKVLLLATLENIPLASNLGGFLCLECVGDLGHLGDGDRVVVRDGSECSDDTLTLLRPVVGDEPSGRLGKDRDTSDEDEGKDDLESDGETPGDGRVDAA